MQTWYYEYNEDGQKEMDIRHLKIGCTGFIDLQVLGNKQRKVRTEDIFLVSKLRNWCIMIS